MEEAWIFQIEQPEEIIKGLITPFRTLVSNLYPKFEFGDGEIEDFLSERFKEILASDEPVTIEDPIHQNSEIYQYTSKGQEAFYLGNKRFEYINAYEILVITAN